MRLFDELPDVGEVAEHRVDVGVVGDVIAVIAQRRGIERQEPERIHAQVLQVWELVDQAPEVAAPIPVAVAEGPDVQLVEHGVLEPQWIVVEPERLERLAAPGRGLDDRHGGYDLVDH